MFTSTARCYTGALIKASKLKWGLKYKIEKKAQRLISLEHLAL